MRAHRESTKRDGQTDRQTEEKVKRENTERDRQTNSQREREKEFDRKRY